MIYNPVYNFLFVHIQKTAGMSITKALFNIPQSEFIAPKHYRLKDLCFIKTKPFIFAVVRNPFTRLISWYEMMKKWDNHNDFSRYLLNYDYSKNKNVRFIDYIRRTKIINETNDGTEMYLKNTNENFNLINPYVKSISFNQIDYLTNASDQIICDKIMRFENIHFDWADLVKMLNLPILPILDHENFNPNKINVQDYYKRAEDRDYIAQLYKKDFEFFKYKFPE